MRPDTMPSVLVRLLLLLDSLLRTARVAGLKRRLKRCGRGLVIDPSTSISGAEDVEIGDDVSIAGQGFFYGRGGITIGSNVAIASHVAIVSQSHDYARREWRANVVSRPVIIEDDVWLGAHCVVMPGVRVGRGAVVAAGAVVNADVAPETIVGGVPAGPIKPRMAS